MARVIDVRGSDGELIVLGGALTLPTSDNIVSSVLAGSLRYDAPSQSLQMYNGTVWAQATGGTAGGVASFNGRTSAVTLLAADITSALGYTPITNYAGDSNISVAGGYGASGGTITLADTTVVPGTYRFASITVDSKGRLNAATGVANSQPMVTGSRSDSSTSGALASLLDALVTLGLVTDQSTI